MAPPLGLASNAVVLVPYDERWPSLYREERDRLAEAVSALGARIEHIGSTSVPGLAAKPVVDILVGRRAVSMVAEYVTALAPLGYKHMGDHGVSGRDLFRRGDPPAYHLHLVVCKLAVWRQCLTFRDALRNNPRLAADYVQLKTDLAARYPEDREAYLAGKAPFITRVLGSEDPPTVEIPIDGTLDLHTFSPGEVTEILTEYLEVCALRGIHEVRVVHGKGTGALRRTVEAVLSRSPRVANYRAADETAGGWGAILVTVAPSR